MHTFNIGSCHLTSKTGIFGEILEVAACEGVTFDVRARCQEHTDPEMQAFSPQGFADLLPLIG